MTLAGVRRDRAGRAFLPESQESEMEFCRVLVESHAHCSTVYVAGFLADSAASRLEDVMAKLATDVAVVRLDLRAVDLIDPDSFVRVARALNAWRDSRRGRVTIEFPYRSLRAERRHLHLMGQPATSGMAVNTAIN